MAVEDLLSEARELFSAVQGYLSTIVIALVIVLLGFVLGRLADRGLYKLLLRTSFDDKMYALFGRRRRYARATRVGIVRLIYVITALVALDRLNVSGVAITLVLGIFALILLASFILAGIEVVPNLLARGELARRGIVQGDKVEVTSLSGVIKGTIVDITLTDVQVKRAGGEVLFIPNASFLKTTLLKKR